jgi:DNA adenine methylase
MQKQLSHPLLRTYSSKFKICDWILSYFPKHKVYVEPFGGCASILLNKLPSEIEVYNDLNADIYNLFNILRDSEKTKKLIHAIQNTPFSKTEYNSAFRNTVKPIEKARRLLLRTQLEFFSENKDPLAQNIPYLIGSWNDQPRILQYASERLRNTIIENRDALEIIDLYDSSETLFFIDVPLNRDRFLGSEEELISKVLSVQGKVVLCGWDNDLYHHSLTGWMMKKRIQPGRSKPECLWICPKSKQFDLFEGLMATGR